VKAVKLSDLFE